MILALFGTDPLAIRRRLAELRDEADGGTGMLATNLTVFDVRDAKPGEIVASAMAVPFLAPKRVVQVDGLLDRFEASGQRSAPSIKPWEALFEGLAGGVPDSTMLILTGGAVGARNPALTRLKKLPGVEVEQLMAPDRRSLPRFVENEATARGLSLDRGAAAALTQRLTGDTIAMAAELDKLALYTLGRRATPADVDLVVASDPESRIFDFTDAVFDGDAVRAYETARNLLQGSDTIDGLIAMVATTLRTLAQVVDMLEEGQSHEEIGVAIRRDRYPKLRDQVIGRARRLGPDGIRRAYAALASVDRGRKLGELDDAAIIEVLVGRLVPVRS